MLVEFILLSIELPILMGYMAISTIKPITIHARNRIPSPSIFLYGCYDISNHVKDIVLSVFFESEPYCLAIGLV